MNKLSYILLIIFVNLIFSGCIVYNNFRGWHGSGWLHKKDVAWVDSSSFPSLPAALTSSSGKTLIIQKSVIVDSEIIISPDIHILVLNGGLFKKENKGRLIIKGSFEAPFQRIFEGFDYGDIVFGGDSSSTGFNNYGNENQNIGSSISGVKPVWWGAKNNRTEAPQTTAALNFAIDCALISNVPLDLTTPGVYLVNRPIVGNHYKNIMSNLTIRGAISGTPYGTPLSSTIIEQDGSGFLDDEPILDMRNISNCNVYNIGIFMKKGGTTRGIEFGDRNAPTNDLRFANHTVQGCTIFGGKIGIFCRNAGINKIINNNISYASCQGIYLYTSGDTNLIGNYINSVNVDYNGNDLLMGAGIVIDQYGGSLSIIGGKIEWNAKGVIIRRSSSVKISAVHFDVNRFFHIGVISQTPDDLMLGNIVTGNNFSSGGTKTDSNGLGGAHIVIASLGATPDSTLTGVISNNNFTKGDDFTLLNGPKNNGPSFACIKIIRSCAGIINYVLSGNQMTQCSAQYTIVAEGDGIFIKETGNSINLDHLIKGGALVN